MFQTVLLSMGTLTYENRGLSTWMKGENLVSIISYHALMLLMTFKCSNLEMFFKNTSLKKFTLFTEKSNTMEAKKLTLLKSCSFADVSQDISKIFNIIHPVEHIWTATRWCSHFPCYNTNFLLNILHNFKNFRIWSVSIMSRSVFYSCKRKRLLLATNFIEKKMKFSIKDFFTKCDQIRRKLRIWSHLLKKSLIENFIFCAVISEQLLTGRKHEVHTLYCSEV